MIDILAWVMIFAILGGAIGYIAIQKRNGVKCIGCPSEARCGCTHDKDNNCGCHENFESSCACVNDLGDIKSELKNA